MCLCGTDVQYSNFVSPDHYRYHLQLSTDSQFGIQLGTPISTPTTRMPFIQWLYFIYQYTGQIISFQMMFPLRSFDDVDRRERDQKKTDDLRTMTTLGPRTLLFCQPRVTVTSYFVYKVIRDLYSIDHLCINPIRRIGLLHK